jgi:fibronectin type 3 domain-containing protein
VSTSLTNPIAIIGLSGTGVVEVPYQVSLSWDAPSSSPDPVAGYNVYRSPDGASTYQQLNTAVVTQTSYVDTGVQDGQSYDYIVESVDSSGIESAPSNTATVPIP